MRIILASNSPRRKELLAQIGIEFDVIPSEFEENVIEMPPEALVQHFAYMKAKDVAEKIRDDIGEEQTLVIGSDTIVYLETVMGKPKDEQDAFDMLKRLSGKAHYVMSGLSVIEPVSGRYAIEYEKTKVIFKTLSDEEIWDYIKSGEPMDKAGAYAIQGLGSLFVEGIEGDYFNVVGLPIYRLSLILKKGFGVKLLEK